MIPSPCIGLCRIEDATALCLGCARTRTEIAGWGGMAEGHRAAVWAVLPGRRTTLGIGMHRLGWMAEVLRTFVRGTLRAGGGTWVGGISGAVAEFRVGEGEHVSVEEQGAELTARTARAAMRLRLDADVRALAFGPEDGTPSVVALALPRERVTEQPETAWTRVGLDADALRDAGRDETLYDFGLARAAGRFGIRTPDPHLRALLDTKAGAAWPEALAGLGAAIVAASPTRVVRNPLGRIEAFTPIPPPGGRSPAGPHTHFLPDLLRKGGDTPPGVPVPDVYVPCVIYYPNHATAAGHTGRLEDHTVDG